MFRNSHNSKGASTRAGNAAPRWRMVFIALVLALVIGSAGQTVLAQDGGSIRVKTNTIMLTSIYPTEICVGEYATIRAQVIRERTPIGTTPGFIKPLREQRMVPVNATVADPSIASLGSGEARQVISADSDVPGEVEWLIKGEEEGTTEVVITTDEMDRLPDETFADKPGGWFESDTISKPVPVKVKNCEYKVDLTSNWTIPGEARLTVQAWFDEALLERMDADGQNYTGEADVQWTASLSGVLDCEMNNITVEGGKATLMGHKDNNGARLVVELTFDPTTVSGTGICIGSDGGRVEMNMNEQLTAGPLRLAVPSDTGGASSQTQDLNHRGGTTTGATFIVVYPSNAFQ